ncbi:hypothetical protein FB45DRAFT_746378 [Roridomyces roridus]|uniref:Alpha-1,2-mannosyltransferase n=1 Tax=Roridomyces roridus TaxID=1738132 RepID=A0AAD7BX36_9AGAR|nr:hypothetical protein FB45DRAFT_746378 [Roridomyces roridus]
MPTSSNAALLLAVVLALGLAFSAKPIHRRLFHAIPDYFTLTGVRRPKPVPSDFDIDKAKARPYRPFRWEYHQTMSLKSMDPDRWIELESTYKTRIQQRLELYSLHDKKIIDCLPGAEAACKELMEMVIQFVCARYPKQFSYGADGVFHNRILDIHSDTRTIHPLFFLLQHIPEDFLITLEDKKSGFYTFRAGVSCSSVGWNVSTKIGMNLQQIHQPVPDYKEKMEFSMDRYFSKMPTDKPIQRGSWGIEVGQPLFFQEDEAEFKLSREPQGPPDLSIDDVHLRVDWQTLRRLPRSCAIVFNFKPLFTPIRDFREEPYIPSLLLKILKDGKSSFMEYKSFSHVSHVVLPALEEWAREQEEKGWVPKDWVPRTLAEDPFFPGYNVS